MTNPTDVPQYYLVLDRLDADNPLWVLTSTVSTRPADLRNGVVVSADEWARVVEFVTVALWRVVNLRALYRPMAYRVEEGSDDAA